MKYTFAIALLLATVSAVRITGEPSTVPAPDKVVKKEDPKKDEEVIKAKFAKVAEEKKAMDEKAKETEGKIMEAEEKETDRQKKAYQTAYWGNMKVQADETQRIRDLRERPDGAKNPMESHDVTGGSTPAEHWTSSMPDHIIDNKEGATAPWNSPAPPAKVVSKEPAAVGK